jgi:hypothetical protein
LLVRARRIHLDWNSNNPKTIASVSSKVVLKGQEAVMAKNKTEKCAHPGCNCPAVKGNKYCSPYCESLANRVYIDCYCAHAECDAGETAGAAATAYLLQRRYSAIDGRPLLFKLRNDILGVVHSVSSFLGN